MSEFAEAQNAASERESCDNQRDAEIESLRVENKRLLNLFSREEADAMRLQSELDRAIAAAEALRVELEEQQAYAVALQKQIESQSLLLQVAGRRMARLEKQLAPPEPSKT